MKPTSESFCTACDWHGDGAGISDCPVCGQPITTLDSSAEVTNDPEEYPEELLSQEDEDIQ